MAEVLKNFTPKKRHGGKYPWNEWMDGQTRLLKRGEDYEISTVNMRSSLYMKANSRGLSGAVYDVTDTSLVFQARKKTELAAT